MLNVEQALSFLRAYGYKQWDAHEGDVEIQLIAKIYGLPPRAVLAMFCGDETGE